MQKYQFTPFVDKKKKKKKKKFKKFLNFLKIPQEK